jgi:hypothetical protein
LGPILHQQAAIGWDAQHFVEWMTAALRSAVRTYSHIQRQTPSG